MITVIGLVILGFLAAYQGDKPCDDKCFKEKIEREHDIKKERTDNDWRQSSEERKMNRGF